MDSELRKNFKTQTDVALAIVKANAVSALKEIGVIDSICKKINANTIQWSALDGLYFVKALLERSQADCNELLQHIKDILQTIFKVYDDTCPSNDDVIHVVSKLLPMVKLDLFEFLAYRLSNMIQSASEYALCCVIESSFRCLQEDKPVIKRNINELIRSVLAAAENMATLHMNFINYLGHLLDLCNEKQYVGLWEVVFASYVTLVKPDKIINGYMIGDWASDVIEQHNVSNYFQGDMAKYATPFKISIHNILVEYVDWDAPYDNSISDAEEPITNEEFKKTEQLHYYMYFAKFLILGASSERKVVAYQIERVLEKYSEAPWIVDFALTNVNECQLILNSKDYKDPIVVNILKTLFKVL